MRSVSTASVPALSAGLAVLIVLAPRPAAADKSPLDPAVISEYGQNETPRAAAMGGALRATGSGTTASFLNPAALSGVRVYHIDGLTEVTPETRRWVVGAAIADSTTSRLAGSFSMMGTPMAMDPDGINRSWLDLRLAFAYPITERFVIGVGGRYLKAVQSGIGPFGWSLASGGLKDPLVTDGSRAALINNFTFDIGLVMKPAESVYIAAVGQNLAVARNGFLPLTLGGGIGFSRDALTIEADAIADLDSWSTTAALIPTARVMAGAEYVVGETVPLRLGYQYDQGASLSTLSLGGGFRAAAFSIDVAVKRTLALPGATTIGIGLSYFLEASGLTRPSTGPVPEGP